MVFGCGVVDLWLTVVVVVWLVFIAVVVGCGSWVYGCWCGYCRLFYLGLWVGCADFPVGLLFSVFR